MKRNQAANKRVGSRVGQCSLFESSDSNGWSVCLGRDRSDPAAHETTVSKTPFRYSTLLTQGD
jgi:hypothetical protein